MAAAYGNGPGLLALPLCFSGRRPSPPRVRQFIRKRSNFLLVRERTRIFMKVGVLLGIAHF